jgi:hypothetical protein
MPDMDNEPGSPAAPHMKARKPLPVLWVGVFYGMAAVLAVFAVLAFTLPGDITTTAGAVTVVWAGPDDTVGVVAALLAVIVAALADAGRRTVRE